ncbi:MAG: BMP family ABC transporter substrate-binding protein [Bacilli bacterium]|nr:BMP family ABC transporter substrate-binding protein [Bacilli bacterium]
MKKQLFLLSALALTALTSCGGSSNRYVPGTKLKVGLICLHDEQTTYDNNFIDGFNKAVEYCKGKGWIESSQIERSIAESQDCFDAATRLVNQGCNIIFSDSFGHDAFMLQAAQEYPNVIFSSATGVKAITGGTQNFHNAFASIFEGRYLAGFIAGKYLKEVKGIKKEDIKVGYVGAFDYAEVISGYTSWYLGLKKVFPKATMEVKYTYSWYDYDKENQAAKDLIKDGCELISQHADSMGAPDACKEANIPNVSYNIDTSKVDPKCKETYVAHSRINWQPYYQNVIENTFNGRVIDGEINRNFTGTFGDDSVQCEYNEKLFENCPTAVKDINDMKTALLDGKQYVFDTNDFTVEKLQDHYAPDSKLKPVKGPDKDYDTDTKHHLTRYMADTTGDYVRDTNLVLDLGEQVTYDYPVIAESVYRSAPSFDFIIDGIDVPLIE